MKLPWRAFISEGGQGVLRLRSDTWLVDTKDTAVDVVVDRQRKEEVFQVG